MSSLIEQLNNLKKQQEQLAQKIIEEEERKNKLQQVATIDRLEALIEPITQYLDWSDSTNPNNTNPTVREQITLKFQHQRERQLCSNSIRERRRHHRPIIKPAELLNEEIFVTLLGIIKKQENRISYLEKNLSKN